MLIIDKKYLKKSNDLIRLNGAIVLKDTPTVLQSKIIMCAASQIRPGDTEKNADGTPKFYYLNVKDLINGKASGKDYQNFYSQLDNVMNLFVFVDFKGKELQIPYITGILKDRPGVIGINFPQQIINWYSAEDRFTRISVDVLLKFTSMYSFPAYMFLKSYEGKNIILPIEQLRKILGTKTKYAINRDFIKLIIKPILEEINTKSDILVIENPIVGARKEITENEFTITKRDVVKLPTEIEILVKKYSLEFMEKDIFNYLEEYSEDRILKNLKYSLSMKGIKNIRGYIKKAIVSDYANGLEVLEHKEVSIFCEKCHGSGYIKYFTYFHDSDEKQEVKVKCTCCGG